jgi:hypothetical protein
LSKVELSVLGPFRVLVDGEDVTPKVPAAQRSILGVLAAARHPVPKDDLRRIAGLARSSVDPQLSRLRATLGASGPIHLGRMPRAGWVALDRSAVTVDVDVFLERLEAGARARTDDERAALALLLAADDQWRGAPLDGVTLVDDPSGPVAGGATRVERLVDDLLDERRRARELAARCWLAGVREGLDAGRLERWADEMGDSDLCWYAATAAALERDGAHAGAAVMARWRERGSVEVDAARSGLFAAARRLVEGTEAPAAGSGSRTPAVGDGVRLPARVAAMLARADASHLEGDWDEAERRYAAAAAEARSGGGPRVEAEVLLAMARITWDPSRFDGELEERLVRVLEDLPAGERLLRTRLLACLAGGLYQDGSVDVDRSEPWARQALELVGEIEDPLTAAEVLSRARKALLDVDPPAVQLERSRRILSLAGRSDYHRSIGLLDSIVDLLLLDRVDEARADCERYREIAERTRSPFHRYHVASHEGLWAIFDGRYDDVAASTARAEALGGPFGGIAVAQVVQGQRLWAAYQRRDVAVLRQMLPLVDAGAELLPATRVWEVTGALVAGAIGDTEDAWARLGRAAAATGMFSQLPRGPLRIATLAVAAVTCADLRAAGRDVGLVAASLHRQLDRHPARGVLVGWPAIYLGPKQRFLDMLA